MHAKSFCNSVVPISTDHPTVTKMRFLDMFDDHGDDNCHPLQQPVELLLSTAATTAVVATAAATDRLQLLLLQTTALNYNNYNINNGHFNARHRG